MKINRVIEIINFLNDYEFFNSIDFANKIWGNNQLIINFIESYYLDKMMNPFFIPMIKNFYGFLTIIFSLIKTAKLNKSPF